MEETDHDWVALAGTSARQVYTAARSHAPDDDAAWDAVQEAFLTALGGKGPTHGGDPVGWLCGVARNHARHELRRRGRFESFLVRLALRRTHRPAGAGPHDDRLDLNAAMARLPIRLRDAVALRYVNRMSVEEVAGAQRITVGAAKGRIRRGLSVLRRFLGAGALVLLLTRSGQAAGTSLALLARTGRVAGRAAAAGAAATLGGLGARKLAVASLLILLLIGGAVGYRFRSAASPPSAPPRPPGDVVPVRARQPLPPGDRPATTGRVPGLGPAESPSPPASEADLLDRFRVATVHREEALKSYYAEYTFSYCTCALSAPDTEPGSPTKILYRILRAGDRYLVGKLESDGESTSELLLIGMPRHWGFHRSGGVWEGTVSDAVPGVFRISLARFLGSDTEYAVSRFLATGEESLFLWAAASDHPDSTELFFRWTPRRPDEEGPPNLLVRLTVSTAGCDLLRMSMFQSSAGDKRSIPEAVKFEGREYRKTMQIDYEDFKPLPSGVRVARKYTLRTIQGPGLSQCEYVVTELTLATEGRRAAFPALSEFDGAEYFDETSLETRRFSPKIIGDALSIDMTRGSEHLDPLELVRDAGGNWTKCRLHGVDSLPEAASVSFTGPPGPASRTTPVEVGNFSAEGHEVFLMRLPPPAGRMARGILTLRLADGRERRFALLLWVEPTARARPAAQGEGPCPR